VPQNPDLWGNILIQVDGWGIVIISDKFL